MWLRAAGLVSQAIALGGAAFGLVVLPASAGSTPDRARARTFAATCGASLGVAFLEIAIVAVLTAAFADDGRWPLAAVLFSTTGRAGAVRIAAAGADRKSVV